MTKSEDSGNKTSQVAIAALIGSLVTLILSPIAQTISFALNEHLSAPDLSIEYVEIVRKPGTVKIPKEKLEALVQSQGYKSSLMLGLGQGSELMMLAKKGDFTAEDLQSLINATEDFMQSAKKRITLLASMSKSLKSNPKPQDVEVMAAKFMGPMGRFFPPTAQGSNLKLSLQVKVG